MSDFNKQVCTSKQYYLLKKYWSEQSKEIQLYKELIAPNGQLLEQDRIKKSEATMIIGCMKIK